jgi:hypothetical protein
LQCGGFVETEERASDLHGEWAPKRKCEPCGAFEPAEICITFWVPQNASASWRSGSRGPDAPCRRSSRRPAFPPSHPAPPQKFSLYQQLFPITASTHPNAIKHFRRREDQPPPAPLLFRVWPGGSRQASRQCGCCLHMIYTAVAPAQWLCVTMPLPMPSSILHIECCSTTCKAATPQPYAAGGCFQGGRSNDATSCPACLTQDVASQQLPPSRGARTLLGDAGRAGRHVHETKGGCRLPARLPDQLASPRPQMAHPEQTFMGSLPGAQPNTSRGWRQHSPHAASCLAAAAGAVDCVGGTCFPSA